MRKSFGGQEESLERLSQKTTHVLKIVGERFSEDPSEILGKKWTERLVLARGVVIYVLIKHIAMPPYVVAHVFDRATIYVHKYFTQIEKRITDGDSALAAEIASFVERLVRL